MVTACKTLVLYLETGILNGLMESKIQPKTKLQNIHLTFTNVIRLQKRQMNVTIFMKMNVHYFCIAAYANDIRR